MLTVVFLSPHSDPEAKTGEVDAGGQCVYEYQLAKSLTQSDNVEVIIYCRKRPNCPDISVINDRCKIQRIECGGTRFIPKEQLDPYIDEFADNVVEHMKDNNISPSVLHGHYWDGGKASLLVQNKLGQNIPIIWTPHSLGSIKRRNFKGIENEMKYNFVVRILWETYTMEAATFVIVSTEDEKEKIITEYGIEEHKVKVISPGIDFENFKRISKHESRRRLGLPLDKPIVMSLGRLDKRKGYHNCIKAFAEFDRLFKIDVVLVIFSGKKDKLVEEEQEYLQELKHLTAELKLEDRVLFRESVDYDQVRYLYAASDIYLCLSEYEGFGLSIIESMYMNVPVIATNNGGPVNIITQDYNGIIDDPHDYKSITYSIYMLLADEIYRNMIIANAKGFIRHKYTWYSRARDFHARYERACTNPPSEKVVPFIQSVLNKGSKLKK